MSATYYRPIPAGDPAGQGALPLAGGMARFSAVEILSRDLAPEIRDAAALTTEARDNLTRARAPTAGVVHDRPRLMGIVNVTPDSFSDGGLFSKAEAAVAHAVALTAEGADILDIGGESTRPGAQTVPEADEIARVVPVIEGLRAAGIALPISVDTRKAAVARAALSAGANIVNDVSALSYDPGMAGVVAEAGAHLYLMHAQGDPATMQDAPRYGNVLLDVYDTLADRIAVAMAAGIPKARLGVDPGIGFGKTQAHNLALLRGLSVLHGLGCPVLLGASRKGFIGTLGHAPDARDRVPGSIAVALDAARQGVQIIRVHDVAATRQALALWMALNSDEGGLA